ncbi:hypothetical protein MG290_11255 [Flavobacterium sp. CBA20B-1]|uniref:hypothetical protein n=1 Tax=unclassified Flavobacterium TaxID=196869 RepID=UPI0022242735|nr:MULTISPECIES: hypothetical protein [unclassified Flavobacterium]WCM41522.1 hypothetical protein MG290_11255 [Flavobacterium sp. CBA20B-1]
MKALLNVIKWLLLALTVLLLAYICGITFFHDIVFYMNEKYKIYLIIQLVHLAASLSALFVIWSSQLFDRWKKIDQTLLVVFLSIFGLWYWYKKYGKIYLDHENTKEY